MSLLYCQIYQKNNVTNDITANNAIVFIIFSYERGQLIRVMVQLTANHLGYFDFSLCNLDEVERNKTLGENDVSPIIEEENCFQPLLTLARNTRVRVTRNKNLYRLILILPTNVSCRHCVFRWNYRAGNNWGYCPNERYGRLGCGPQETFRTCSDIAIR